MVNVYTLAVVPLVLTTLGFTTALPNPDKPGDGRSKTEKLAPWAVGAAAALATRHYLKGKPEMSKNRRLLLTAGAAGLGYWGTNKYVRSGQKGSHK
ncbi:hypothetical protein IWQ61_009460 [Dispira simplex]|nr:hypothetical protein IWQ61_009460 [Dispira simplex]